MRAQSLLWIAVPVLLVALLGCGVGEVDEISVEQTMVTELVDIPAEVLASSARRQTFASGVSTVLYLNFDGVTITKGNGSNSASNISFIGGGTVPPFQGDQATRQQVISLVKQLYSKYNIQVVTSRPASGDYDMAVIGGTPSSINLGYGSGVAGVAPMDCSDKMARDIAFIFSDSIMAMAGSKYAQRVAEVTAHESAHTYGLPHSGDGCDLMSYSSCPQLKTFLDKTMNMQSDSNGKCGLYQMNSHQLLLGNLGTAPTNPPPDTTAPKVTITSPASGAKVTSSVTVKATVTDDKGVTKVELLVDGKVVSSRGAAPYDFTATVAAGTHTLKVVGHDAAGNQGSAAVTVTVEAGPAADTTPPVVNITSPAAGSTVGAQVAVAATVTDDKGVTKVELRVDGKLVQTLTASPWSFSATLAAGSHTLQVRGHDAAGNQGNATVTVTVDPSKPSTPQNPTAPNPTQPTQPGTYGAPCQTAADCNSGLCAEDATYQGRFCTQTCVPGANACPSGAGCYPAGTSINVCGPPETGNTNGVDGDALLGSCSMSGSTAAPGLTPLLLLALLLGHLWRRRR